MDKLLKELQVGKRIGDLSKLPEELKSQLLITKTNELEKQIISIFKRYDGVANIDEILVGFYREYHLIKTRSFIANKLYRMTAAGDLFRVQGCKGVYTIPESAS